tara:strand:+ start:163 stop:291 length:129 start_codon:yes stop_codon:yes gene_type:complete
MTPQKIHLSLGGFFWINEIDYDFSNLYKYSEYMINRWDDNVI